MKKIVLLGLLILCIAALPLFAGGSSSKGDPKELRVMIRNIGMANTNDNIINRELEKRTGFKLNWDLKPGEGYPQACATVIASGNYPDAMEFQAGVYPVDLQQLADDGVIWALDDLLAKYGNEFTSTVRPANNWFVSSKDGKRYGIPTRTMDFATSYCIVIRKDWLDKLGLQIPRNSDEYFNVLTAFAQNADKLVGPGRRFVPHGTGTYLRNIMQDCIMEYLMSENGMIGDWNRVDGKIVYPVNVPAYKNVLLTARKFYQAGLIEPEFPLITSRDEAVNRIVGNQYGAWCWFPDSYDEETSPLALQLYTALPELRDNLAFVPYFKDKTGKSNIKYEMARRQMIIFKKTPEEKAINLVKLFNYMVSKEGFFLTELGLEGEHYTINSEGRVVVKDMSTEERVKLGNWTYAWSMKRSYVPIAASNYVRNFMLGDLGISNAVDPFLAYGKAWMQYGVGLTALRAQYEMDLITKKDINFDAVFNEFVTTWNASGGAQVTQEMNELYK